MSNLKLISTFIGLAITANAYSAKVICSHDYSLTYSKKVIKELTTHLNELLEKEQEDALISAPTITTGTGHYSMCVSVSTKAQNNSY